MLLKLAILLSISVFVYASDEAYENRPRGVPAEKASLYEKRSEFKCLDGSKSIPFEQVNDDYCDCQDGSDEPGTSACSNGRFHCRNYGHRALEIPSSRVNDQICDCCDGSDEWDSGVECPNVCKELGSQARKEFDSNRELVQKGYSKRVELAKEGARSMEEHKVELEKMKKELEDIHPIRLAIEDSKHEAEQKESAAKAEEDKKWNESVEQKRKHESSEYFAKFDLNKDEKITIDEFKGVIKEMDKHNTEDFGVTSIFGEETEINAEKFIEKLTEIKQILNVFTQQTTEAPSTTSTTSAPAVDELDAEEELQDDALEPEEVPVSEEDKKPEYSEETKKLIEEADKLREKFREAESKENDLEGRIRESENFLKFEYGSDFAWAPLKGQCPELNQAQYTYRLCLFDRAVQKDRNGHHETGLGNWKEWEGPDDDKYSKQKYSDGQQCWNGPARSTLVHIECGEELELYDVKEPAKCEYEFRLRAPAACPDPSTLKDPFAAHTEL